MLDVLWRLKDVCGTFERPRCCGEGVVGMHKYVSPPRLLTMRCDAAGKRGFVERTTCNLHCTQSPAHWRGTLHKQGEVAIQLSSCISKVDMSRQSAPHSHFHEGIWPYGRHRHNPPHSPLLPPTHCLPKGGNGSGDRNPERVAFISFAMRWSI